MMDRPELNTFLVQPPNKDRSQIFIFLSPATHGGINKERIFILAEVSSSNFDFKNQIQIFINQLAKKYQELEKDNPLIAFENSLEWANRELRENFELKELAQLSMIFGSLRNEHLQFAAGGNIHAHIFYREKEEYKNNDLIKNYSSEADEPGIFFPNLISGVIHQNNFTLFSTVTVLNYLTIDRLQKIITGNKTDEICSRVENLLSEIENKVAFGGILISWPETKESSPLPSSFKLTPNESINRLLKKQKETAQIMSPAVLQSIKKYLQGKKNKNVPSTQEDIKTLKKITKIYTRLTGWQGKISAVWQKILLTLGRVIYKFFVFVAQSFKKISQIDFRSPKKIIIGFKTVLGELKILAKNQIGKIKIKYLSLNLKKRILLPLTTIICCILIISLLVAYFNQKKNEGSANYNQQIKQIEDKINKAESDLIYKNEDGAEQIIKEVKNLLALLPVKSKNEIQVKEKLSNSLQPLIYKLQKIQKVDSTLELNLEQLRFEKPPEIFFKTSSYFIFFTPNTAAIQTYNKTTQQLTKIINDKIASWQHVFLQKDESLLILSDKNSLTQFDPEKETFTLKETSWPVKNSQITLAVTYNAKLYSLDAKNNQIFRHLPSTTGFGKGEPWLNSSAPLDFSGALSLAVDGNIYVGKQNGQIYKLESGNLIDFDINFLDPVLNSLTKLYTKNGSDKLFVLDKEKQRVIIWNKTNNKLISQLTSPEWDNLTDFAVDEKAGKIYLLNGMEVLSAKY